MSTIIKISRLNIIVFLIIYRIHLFMAIITKLQLSEELYNIAYDPITLDQEESSSTTSAPSSNYLKSVVASLNQSISDLSENINDYTYGLWAGINMNSYYDQGYTKISDIINNTGLRGTYCLYGNAKLDEFNNIGYNVQSWFIGIITIQGGSDGTYFIVGCASNTSYLMARGDIANSGTFTKYKIIE